MEQTFCPGRMGLLRELSIKRRERERHAVIPALGRQMQEDCQEPKVSLHYLVASRPAGLRVRISLKKLREGPGGMAQQLRASTALAEGWSSVSSTHIR